MSKKAQVLEEQCRDKACLVRRPSKLSNEYIEKTLADCVASVFCCSVANDVISSSLDASRGWHGWP